MSLGCRQHHTSQWLKDTIWWPTSRIARTNFLSTYCHIWSFLDISQIGLFPGSMSQNVAALGLRPLGLTWMRPIVFLQQVDLLWLWLWMDKKEIGPPTNPDQLSPNLSLRQFFCGPANFKPGLSKRGQIKIMRGMIWGETDEEISALWGWCLINLIAGRFAMLSQRLCWPCWEGGKVRQVKRGESVSKTMEG